MLKSINFLQKNLRGEEKCCNFASAIGKQRGAALEAGSRVPGAKIENNDMMPQDKQRQSVRLDAAETREHEVNFSGFPSKRFQPYILRRPGQTKFRRYIDNI